MKIRLVLILGWWWRVVPAHAEALTVEEILLRKRNGVSEQTVQMMLRSEMQAQSFNSVFSPPIPGQSSV